jgi:hypothetical protein
VASLAWSIGSHGYVWNVRCSFRRSKEGGTSGCACESSQSTASVRSKNWDLTDDWPEPIGMGHDRRCNDNAPEQGLYNVANVGQTLRGVCSTHVSTFLRPNRAFIIIYTVRPRICTACCQVCPTFHNLCSVDMRLRWTATTI